MPRLTPPFASALLSPSCDSAPAMRYTRLARRGFLQSGLAAAALASLPPRVQAMTVHAAERDPGPAPMARPQDVHLNINGKAHTLQIEPRVTLLDALRETLALTGTKKGCDHGQCGACTVLVGGRRINACLTLAVMQEGARITTIEGLADGAQLTPLQAAFIQHDALQCGYCTPGQICSATALLDEWRNGDASAVTANLDQPLPTLDDDEIRERMSGNLCRCGAYSNIVRAIADVARGAG